MGSSFEFLCDACLAPRAEWREPNWTPSSKDRPFEVSLYPYQEEGARWLAERNSGILADDMGVGKTVQAIASLPPFPAVIVVCPVIAKRVWMRHLWWRDDTDPGLLYGRNALCFWPKPGQALILNYEILSDKLPKGRPPKNLYVILDEAAYCKSKNSKRTKRATKLCKVARDSGGSSLLLTGTPLDNRPPDLWSLLKVAGLTDKTWQKHSEFVKDFGGTKGHWGGYEWKGKVNSEACRRLLPKVMMRRTKEQVLPGLPPKVYSTIDVPLPDDAKRYIDEACKHLFDMTLSAEENKERLKEAMEASVNTRNKIPGFAELALACKYLATAKIPSLLKLVEEYEFGNKTVIVWSRHTAPIKALENRPGWASIHGGVGAVKRGHIESEFMAGRLKGLACTIRAAGTALTLTRASYAIYVDRDWSPSWNRQSEDRIHRIGQDGTCFFTFLVAQHVLDQRLHDLIEEKTRTIDDSIGEAFDGKDRAA